MLKVHIAYNDNLIENVIHLGMAMNHFLDQYVQNIDEIRKDPATLVTIKNDFDRVYAKMVEEGFTGRLYY